MKLLLLIAIVCFGSCVQAQQPDSVKTEISQEMDSLQPDPTHRFLKAYRKFIRAQVEEKTLFKLGAVPELGYAGYVGAVYGLQTELGVEHKLMPALSVLASLRTHYGHMGNQFDEVTMRGTLAGRWYYAQNRRMRTGKSANNFSNQYLTLQASQHILSRKRMKQTGEVESLDADNWVGIGFGVQRRLGRFGYLDWTIGPAYAVSRPNRFVLSASVYIGLGL